MKLYEGAFARARIYDVRTTALELQNFYRLAGFDQSCQGVQNVLAAHREGAFTSEQAMTALIGFYALGAATAEKEYYKREARFIEGYYDQQSEGMVF